MAARARRNGPGVVRTMDNASEGSGGSYNLHFEIEVEATPLQVYEVWLDSKKHAEMIRTHVQTSARVGARFIRGVSSGITVELMPGKRIVEAWRNDEWKEGDYSVVTVTLEPQAENTKLIVDHKGIPLYFKGRLEKGWGEFYLPQVQAYFSKRERTPY